MSSRASRSVATTQTAAIAPPTSRQWMAHAIIAPITQKPGTVASKPAPFTHGVSAIISMAMKRSSPRSSGVRRRGAEYAQIATPVHTTMTAVITMPAVGCTKLSRR